METFNYTQHTVTATHPPFSSELCTSVQHSPIIEN